MCLCEQTFCMLTLLEHCVFQAVAHSVLRSWRGGVCIWRVCQQPVVSTQSCKQVISLKRILNNALKSFLLNWTAFLMYLTGSQQRVIDFQRSAQITSQVSVNLFYTWRSDVLLLFCAHTFLSSLSRFCMEAVLQHRERLSSYWDCLPKHLLHSLKLRMAHVNTLGS